jgi:hypothetical protein
VLNRSVLSCVGVSRNSTSTEQRHSMERPHGWRRMWTCLSHWPWCKPALCPLSVRYMQYLRIAQNEHVTIKSTIPAATLTHHGPPIGTRDDHLRLAVRV